MERPDRVEEIRPAAVRIERWLERRLGGVSSASAKSPAEAGPLARSNSRQRYLVGCDNALMAASAADISIPVEIMKIAIARKSQNMGR